MAFTVYKPDKRTITGLVIKFIKPEGERAFDAFITEEVYAWLAAPRILWAPDVQREMLGIVPCHEAGEGCKLTRRPHSRVWDASAGIVGRVFPSVAGYRFRLVPHVDATLGRMLVFSIHQHDAGCRESTPAILQTARTVAQYVRQALDAGKPLEVATARAIGKQYGLTPGEVAQEIEEARLDWAEERGIR